MAKLLSFGYAASEKPKIDTNTQDRQGEEHRVT